jgi:hypothetical protein
MVCHFETTTHVGNPVRVSIDRNIAWVVIDVAPYGIVREHGIAIPGGDFERYADHPDFVVRHVEREFRDPGDDEPFDSEELIQMYRPDTGIRFEWRLIFDEWSLWDRIEEPTEGTDNAPTITRDRVAAAAD